jgi:hypothetical protein
MDPTGLGVKCYRIGNVVALNIRIDFHGPGADKATIDRFDATIERLWSGPIGRYVVITSVSRGGDIDISIPLGKGRAWTMVGGTTGEWPQERYPDWTPAHEAGHLMGLDAYDETTNVPFPGWDNDIMGAPNQRPTEKTIAVVMATCGCVS